MGFIGASSQILPEIGDRVHIYWERASQWYQETVIREEGSAGPGMFYVKYNDGRERFENFITENWMAVPEVIRYWRKLFAKEGADVDDIFERVLLQAGLKKASTMALPQMGDSILVYWDGDAIWYPGTVAKVGCPLLSGNFVIAYDDGDLIVEDLCAMEWKSTRED